MVQPRSGTSGGVSASEIRWQTEFEPHRRVGRVAHLCFRVRAHRRQTEFIGQSATDASQIEVRVCIQM